MSQSTENWSVQEVGEWIAGILTKAGHDPTEVVAMLEKHLIDGEMLFELEGHHLDRMGIHTLGIQLRILKGIRILKQKDQEELDPATQSEASLHSGHASSSRTPIQTDKGQLVGKTDRVHQIRSDEAKPGPTKQLEPPAERKRQAYHDSESSGVRPTPAKDPDLNSKSKPQLTPDEIRREIARLVQNMSDGWTSNKLPLLKDKGHQIYSCWPSAVYVQQELDRITSQLKESQAEILEASPETLAEVKRLTKGIEPIVHSHLECKWTLDLLSGLEPPKDTCSKSNSTKSRSSNDRPKEEMSKANGKRATAQSPSIFELSDNELQLPTRTSNSHADPLPKTKTIEYKGQFGLDRRNLQDILQAYSPATILKKIKALQTQRAGSPDTPMSIEDASLMFLWEEFLVQYQKGSMVPTLKRTLADPGRFTEFCGSATTRLAKPLKHPSKSPLIPEVVTDDSALDIQRREKAKESALATFSTDPQLNDGIMIGEGVSVPTFFSRFLKPHQIDGVRFLWKNLVAKNNGCILAHSMGLGKTLQVVVFLCTLIQTSRNAPALLPRQLKRPSILILCPISVRANWKLEFKKWIPHHYLGDFSISVIQDTGLDRLNQKISDIQYWYSNGGILIMNYETWRGLSEAEEPMGIEGSDLSMQACLLNPGPSLVICDEGHIIKNPSSKISTLVKRIATPSKICLTGYPIQNNLMEYWCMVDFVYPGYLGPEAVFEDFFCKPITNALYYDCSRDNQKLAQLRLYILSTVLDGIVARKDASLLTQGLPPKVEMTISCKLSPLQSQLYNDFLARFSGALRTLEIGFFAKGHVLSDVCNHPMTLKARADKRSADLSANESNLFSINHKTIQEIIQKYGLDELKILDTNRSSKFKVLTVIINETMRRKEKMLIFTRSLAVLDLIDDYIRQCTNFKHLRLDGFVQAQDRQSMIETFNNDSTNSIFAISTMTGSLGINLIRASRVVLYDVDWNPSHSEQAIARVFRFGQSKPTFIYRLYTHGTFEEALLKVSAAKSALFSRVVDQTDAPSDHTRLQKRYFKTPGPAPTFNPKAMPEIRDDVLKAVGERCGYELCQVEVLERDYDAIEYGISEEIKAKAKETILAGRHMGNPTPPNPSPVPQTAKSSRKNSRPNSPAPQTVASPMRNLRPNPSPASQPAGPAIANLNCNPPSASQAAASSRRNLQPSPSPAPQLAASEITKSRHNSVPHAMASPPRKRSIASCSTLLTEECASPLKRHKSDRSSAQEVDVQPEFSETTVDLVSPDVERVIYSSPDGGGARCTLFGDMDNPPSPMNVIEDDVPLIGTPQITLVETQPGSAVADGKSSAAEKNESHSEMHSALKPIQTCMRRLVPPPPRSLPTPTAPSKRINAIPQIEKGTRQPKPSLPESPPLETSRPQPRLTSSSHRGNFNPSSQSSHRNPNRKTNKNDKNSRNPPASTSGKGKSKDLKHIDDSRSRSGRPELHPSLVQPKEKIRSKDTNRTDFPMDSASNAMVGSNPSLTPRSGDEGSINVRNGSSRRPRLIAPIGPNNEPRTNHHPQTQSQHFIEPSRYQHQFAESVRNRGKEEPSLPLAITAPTTQASTRNLVVPSQDLPVRNQLVNGQFSSRRPNSHRGPPLPHHSQPHQQHQDWNQDRNRFRDSTALSPQEGRDLPFNKPHHRPNNNHRSPPRYSTDSHPRNSNQGPKRKPHPYHPPPSSHNSHHNSNNNHNSNKQK